jgi:hypothetical protein
MKRTLIYLLLLYICNVIAQDTAGEDSSRIQISNHVSKTALFPGDQISYVIEINCGPEVGILLEDLDEGELDLTGMQIDASDSSVVSDDHGTSYKITYALSTYETGAASLKIGDLRVRYYFKRPGQRIEDVATVGEVTIPGIILSLRSTLPADLEGIQLRDIYSNTGQPSWLNWAGTLAIILILLSALPVGTTVLTYWQKKKLESNANEDEKPRSEITSQFDEIRNIDVNDLTRRREAYQQLENIIRDFLGRVVGHSARASTASDLTYQTKILNLNLPVEELAGVLSDCEYARYGRDENIPEIDAFTRGIQITEKLVTGS